MAALGGLGGIMQFLLPMLGSGTAMIGDVLGQGASNIENLIRLMAAGGEAYGLRDRIMPQFNQTLQHLGNMSTDNRLNAQNRYQSQVTDPVLGRMQGLYQDYGNLASNVNQTLEERLARNMQYLEGAGAQERRDIQGAFSDRQGGLTQDLTSRGLGGSTVLPTASAAIERERADALGGLEERLRGQRIATDASLSGDIANAQASLGGQALGARGNYIGAMMGLNQGGFGVGQNAFGADLANQFQFAQAGPGMDIALSNGIMQLLSSVGSGFQPTPPGVYQLYGQSMAPPVNYPEPSAWESFGANLFGGATQGLTTGGGLALGKRVFGCIWSECPVSVEGRGIVPLGNVEIGDKMLGADSKFHRVLAIDRGKPHPDNATFIRIINDKGWFVVATLDHIIFGKPAEHWRPGYRLPGGRKITEVSGPLMGVECACDVLLEDCDVYWCNGYQVHSMLSHYKLTAQEIAELQVANAV